MFLSKLRMSFYSIEHHTASDVGYLDVQILFSYCFKLCAISAKYIAINIAYFYFSIHNSIAIIHFCNRLTILM